MGQFQVCRGLKRFDDDTSDTALLKESATALLSQIIFVAVMFSSKRVDKE